MHRRTASLVAAILVITTTSAVAQWLNYPTPGIPRTADGKPDLSAPAPKTADGKPDLTGIWGMPCSVSNFAVVGDFSAKPTINCSTNSLDRALPLEFSNIGRSLKDGLPYQSWAAELVRTTREKNRTNDPLTHCLPIGMVRLHTMPLLRKMVQVPGLLVILNEENASYRQFSPTRGLSRLIRIRPGMATPLRNGKGMFWSFRP
jgi:hypothetical protein